MIIIDNTGRYVEAIDHHYISPRALLRPLMTSSGLEQKLQENKNKATEIRRG